MKNIRALLVTLLMIAAPVFAQTGGGNLLRSLNLSDVPNKATARLNLGLAEKVSVWDYLSTAQKSDVSNYTGALDVSAAIQSAVNALPSAGGEVILPAGRYRITAASIVLPTYTTFHCPDGNNATYLQTSVTNRSIITATDATAVRIIGCEFIGPGATSTVPAILFTNTILSIFDSVKVRLFDVGIRFVKGSNSSFSNTIQNSNIVSNNSYAIDAQALTNNLNIYNTSFGGGGLQGLRYIDSTALAIYGGDCEGVSGSCIYIDGVTADRRVGAIISGMYIENNSSSDGGDITIGATNTVLGISITGNYFAGNATITALRPVKCNKCTGVSMTGNTSEGGYAGGSNTPQLGTVTGVTILGNDGWADQIVPNVVPSTGITIGTGTNKVLSGVSNVTFTPIDASGASLTFVPGGTAAIYSTFGPGRVSGNMIVTYPVTIDASNAVIGGLPITASSSISSRGGAVIAYTDSAAVLYAFLLDNTTTIRIYKAAGVQATNADLSGKTISINFNYSQ